MDADSPIPRRSVGGHGSCSDPPSHGLHRRRCRARGRHHRRGSNLFGGQAESAAAQVATLFFAAAGPRDGLRMCSSRCAVPAARGIVLSPRKARREISAGRSDPEDSHSAAPDGPTLACAKSCGGVGFYFSPAGGRRLELTRRTSPFLEPAEPRAEHPAESAGGNRLVVTLDYQWSGLAFTPPRWSPTAWSTSMATRAARTSVAPACRRSSRVPIVVGESAARAVLHDFGSGGRGSLGGAGDDPTSARHIDAVSVACAARRHVASVALLRRLPRALPRDRSQRRRQFGLCGSGRHNVRPL
jgi:hypothetical protein